MKNFKVEKWMSQLLLNSLFIHLRNRNKNPRCKRSNLNGSVTVVEKMDRMESDINVSYVLILTIVSLAKIQFLMIMLLSRLEILNRSLLNCLPSLMIRKTMLFRSMAQELIFLKDFTTY